MARVTGALFSMSASGSVGKTVTYGTWKGRQWCREWFTPQNPKTGLQTNVRLAMTLLVAKWQGETQAQKDKWDVYAAPFNMAGVNKFIGRGMDAYISQLTSAGTPVSVAVTGDPPAEVWVWT